jgi:hypothetical protein
MLVVMKDYIKIADKLAETLKEGYNCNYDNFDSQVFELRAALKLILMSGDNNAEYREKAINLIRDMDGEKLRSGLVDFIGEQIYFAGCWKMGIDT